MKKLFAIISLFKSVSNLDLSKIRKDIELTAWTWEMSAIMARSARISRTKFIELAILSAVINSKEWTKAEKRMLDIAAKKRQK